MQQAARGYLDEGFTAVKFGWGVFGRDPDHDVRLVEAARKEIGDKNDLLIDTGWFVERTPKQAIAVVRSLEPYRPYFVEEILHPEDYDVYKMEYQNGAFTSIPVDAFGRMMFPPYPVFHAND